jgi:hypothetical protein
MYVKCVSPLGHTCNSLTCGYLLAGLGEASNAAGHSHGGSSPSRTHAYVHAYSPCTMAALARARPRTSRIIGRATAALSQRPPHHLPPLRPPAGTPRPVPVLDPDAVQPRRRSCEVGQGRQDDHAPVARDSLLRECGRFWKGKVVECQRPGKSLPPVTAAGPGGERAAWRRTCAGTR